jgi:hypothetical protein
MRAGYDGSLEADENMGPSGLTDLDVSPAGAPTYFVLRMDELGLDSTVRD